MKTTLKWFAVIFAASVLIFGCGKDNPVQSDDTDEDHAEAAGLVIFQNDAEVVRYESGAVTGTISVKTGEETPLLTVLFIDQNDGDLFTPDSDHHSFAGSVADESIAVLVQYDSEDAWTFHIAGLKVGETTLVVKILHGDHDDFVSLPIPVEVTG